MALGRGVILKQVKEQEQKQKEEDAFKGHPDN